VLILPWNLKDEIMQQMAFIDEWGGQFVVPIPEPQVYAANPATAASRPRAASGGAPRRTVA